MAISQEELIAFVAQCYDESLAGATPLALAYRRVFDEANLAGPLAVALRDGLVAAVDDALFGLLESARQKLLNPPEEEGNVGGPTQAGGGAPAGKTQNYREIHDAFAADWSSGKLTSFHKYLADMVAAKPEVQTREYREQLHNMLHMVSEIDRRDPSSIPAETTLALETLLEIYDELSGSAVNTHAFSLLIPAGRYADAAQLLSVTAKNTPGGQAVNALSNLSQVYLLSGMPIKAEALLLAVESSGDPWVAVEAAYWLGHIYLAAGYEKRGQDRLANALFAGELKPSDEYAEKVRGCIAGNCSEPDLNVENYPSSSAKSASRTSQKVESLPDVDQAHSIVREAFDLPSGTEIDLQLLPAVERWSTSDWIDLLGDLESTWGQDWTTTDPELTLASVLLARSDPGRRRGGAEFLARHVGFETQSQPVTAQRLFAHLVDACASFNLEWACAFGLVLLEGSQNIDSEQATAFRSRVITVVLEAMVRSRREDLVDHWLANYAGVDSDNEWLMWSALGHSLCGRVEETFSQLDKCMSDDLLTQSVAIVREVSRGLGWDEVCTRWDSAVEAASKIVYRSQTGKNLIRGTLQNLPGPAHWSSSPLGALALGMFEFYDNQPTAAVRYWISGGVAFGGIEEVKVLRRSLIDSNEIDVYGLFETESAYVAGATVAILHKHFPFDCVIGLSKTHGMGQLYLEGNADAVGFVAKYLVNNPSEELVSWPFDVEALFALTIGRADEKQTGLYAQNERLDVRLMVAESGSISDSIVRGLLKATPPAEQDQTALTLLRNPGLSHAMAGEVSALLDADSLWKIASLDTMPPDLLGTWSQHESASVRRAVAANPNTPLEILEELALDSSLAVRDAVLANPAATDEIRALVSLQG